MLNQPTGNYQRRTTIYPYFYLLTFINIEKTQGFYWDLGMHTIVVGQTCSKYRFGYLSTKQVYDCRNVPNNNIDQDLVYVTKSTSTI